MNRQHKTYRRPSNIPYVAFIPSAVHSMLILQCRPSYTLQGAVGNTYTHPEVYSSAHFRYRVMLKFYNSHFPLSTSLTTATFIVLVNGKGAMSQSAAKPCLSIMRKRMVLQIWDARKMLHAFGTNAKGRCRDIILCAIRVSITSPTQGNDTTQSKHSRTRCISLLHCNILQLLMISSLFCSDLVELSYTQHFQM